MAIVAPDLGIDLGTSNTLVHVRKKGIQLNEPTLLIVAGNQRRTIKAIGQDALQLVGRTTGGDVAVRPLQDGMVKDFELTEAILRYFIRKAIGVSHLLKPRIYITVPSRVSPVEKRVIREAASSAGARRTAIHLIDKPFASAFGSGLPVFAPEGSMVVDVGGGTTEVAIISLGNIVTCGSVQCGGDAMDMAIVNHMQNAHHLLIGIPTAENIKISIGSAYDMAEPMTMEVKGHDMAQHGNRLPRAVTITSEEIRQALEKPVTSIVQVIRKTIDSCLPELAARLIDNGITMAGGGSILRGLDKLISEETGLAVTTGKDPLKAVVNGTGLMLEHANKLFSQPPNSMIGRGSRV